ncbi:MAG: type II secretion system protein, partial [Verrucomicrobiota bacterium]
MKKLTQSGTRKQSAFTLIELLVVMAIIGVLAALTFPTVKGIKENATRKKVKTELHRRDTVIESYQAKYGFYPPDNPGKPELNQLYFELVGTEPFVDGGVTYFRTLDAGAKIPNNDVNAIFGAGVTAFVNHTHDTSGEVQAAVNFFSKAGLPSSQIGAYQV